MSSAAHSLLSFFTHFFGPSKRILPPPPKTKPVSREPIKHHYLNVTVTKAILDTTDTYSYQSSSLLLSKIPVEIRNLIWMHVLGNNIIHFYYKDCSEALCAYICGKQKAWTCESIAHGGKGLKTLSACDQKEMPVLGCMGVLTSCRALYFETTQILYSRNTFDISDCWSSIEHLPWLLPLSSLSQLSTITVTILDLYAIPNCIDFAAWQALWKTLALLRGLKNLKVEVAVKEKLEKATIKKADLMKIEDQLLGYLKALEEIPGRRKAKWELIFPYDLEGGESEAAKELARNGWKITRV